MALLKYSFFAVVLAPAAGAFLSASGIASDYWTGWKIVFLSEVLAFLTVTPVLLSWVTEGRVFLRRPRSHHIEGAILIAALALVSYIVFTLPEGSRTPARHAELQTKPFSAVTRVSPNARERIPSPECNPLFNSSVGPANHAEGR
jgi:hypothetical protein